MGKNDIKGYLISESSTLSQPKIVKDQSDITIFDTILQESDEPNRNKRVYPKEVLKNGIQSEYVKERLKRKNWYGEAGHPIDQDIKRQMYIDQTRISHLITDVWFEGNNLMGRIECAQTRVGKDMQGLVRQNSDMAFSMRGFGPVSKKRGDIVQIESPLNILTYDWVEFL